MVTCCECQFEGASSWHWRMHEWVERQRCAFRFGCRNAACLDLHTIAEQEHNRTKQELGQREWEAECDSCCVGTCRYGAVCQRTARSAIAYDSSYEHNEDGWPVVGDDRGNNYGADPVGRTDGASLGAPGRFDALVETVEDGVLGDGFFDCACDHTEFRFTIREQRRAGQQE